MKDSEQAKIKTGLIMNGMYDLIICNEKKYGKY